jgi:hypothetical protein
MMNSSANNNVAANFRKASCQICVITHLCHDLSIKSSFKVCMSDAHTTALREDHGCLYAADALTSVYLSALIAERSIA